METVNFRDAKIRLSQLVDKAASGEDVVVSHNGKPIVRITHLREPKRRIKFGLLKGKVIIAADFDAPLPDEMLASIEGGDTAAARHAHRFFGQWRVHLC